MHALDRNGIPIDSPIFRSHWALILFSQHPLHRRFQLPHAAMIIEDQPLIDRAPGADVVAFQPDLREAEACQTINPVFNFARTTNTVILQNNVMAATAHAARPKKSPKLHWFASVTFEMFQRRAGEIAGHWTGLQEQQVQIALNTAFALTRHGAVPVISLSDLERQIALALEAAQLPIGLKKSASSEWINKMFGEGSRHDYVWVRRYLTEPDFAPPYELPLR